MGMRKREHVVAVDARRNRIAASLAAFAHSNEERFAEPVFPVGAAAGHHNNPRALAGVAGLVSPVGEAAGPGNSLQGLVSFAAAERIFARKIVNLHERGSVKGAQRISLRFLLRCFRFQTIRFRYLRIGAHDLLLQKIARRRYLQPSERLRVPRSLAEGGKGTTLQCR